MRHEGVKPYLLLAAIVLAGTLPFLSRGVYTDEPQYLLVARSAVHNGWKFPQDTSWVFFGKTYANMGTQTHLPLIEYYMAILIKAVGRFDPRTFRLFFLPFPILAVISFFRIARKFTTQPILVSCLFAVSPAFLVLSPALMMDIPLLAFLLTGIAIHLDALETGKRLWLSSLCFILAVGTAYTALIPLGCLFLWTVANRRPLREWIAIAAAPAAMWIWLGIMAMHFGATPAKDLIRYYTSHSQFSANLLPMLSFIGGVAVFPWLFLIVTEPVRARLRLAIWSVAVSFALTFFHAWTSIPYRLWFVILSSSGIGLLALFARKSAKGLRGGKAAGYGFLVLWLPSVLLFLLLFADMISARYLLLGLPPLLLIVFDDIHTRPGIVAISVTALLSISLAVADYRLVNVYPQWVMRQVVPLQNQGFKIWNASEAGLRFYLEERGIQTLGQEDIRPRGGDLIVRQTSFAYALSDKLEPVLINILREDLPDRYPIRTFSHDASAGFHDSHSGVVPYTISTAPLDHITVFEVSPFVTTLPQQVPGDFSSVPVWYPGGVLLKQTQPEMKFPLTVPRDTTIRYDLEGRGSAIVSANSIVLMKEGPNPIAWKNFRIVPTTWP